MSHKTRPKGATIEVDCRGLQCPLPVLETEKVLAPLAGGAVVHVVCTDPASRIDLEAFCLRSGNQLLRSEQSGNELAFWIRKPATSREPGSG